MKKNLFKITLSILTCVFLFKAAVVRGQASIVSAAVSEFNITPKSLLEVNIMNSGGDLQVTMEAKILSNQNEVLMSVTTKPFHIHKGVNIVSQLNVGIVSVFYAANTQGTYIKNAHALPSGKYHYCASINGVDVSDQMCQDMEAESSAFLFLVSPPDKEEIETKNPMLIWTHSEPFSLNNQTDYYRIIVTDLHQGQSAEAAVNTNIPIYMKNFLGSHQVQYPIDAKELQQGKEYAWQVQKISGGTIVNKTEAWQFKLKPPVIIKDNKYATLKEELDGSYYTVENNKLFFSIQERYYSSGKIKCRILNDQKKEIEPPAPANEINKKELSYKSNGDNRYMINIDELGLKKGFYVLEVTNEKTQKFYLKFLVQ